MALLVRRGLTMPEITKFRPKTMIPSFYPKRSLDMIQCMKKKVSFMLQMTKTQHMFYSLMQFNQISLI